MVPSPYFILDGDAIRNEAQSVALARQPSKPFRERVEELSSITHNQDNFNVATDEAPPDLFGFLDHLPMAQAVLAASDESTASIIPGIATASQSLEGELGDRGKSK